jgi:transposase
MTSMQDAARRRRVVVGVDTHKHIHVAVALDELGGRIEARSFAADRSGYEQLIDWASSLGREVMFGVEGTGSYGAGLASAIRRRSIGVLEVLRTDRRDRRLRGKSDTIDAENAARAVLNGQASAVPKSADGTVEMIRLVKVAKDVAVKARTSAMISLKAVLVNAPAELREQLQPLTKMALIRRCAALRRGPVTDPMTAAKHTLRAIARRWLALDAEIKAHEQVLNRLTTELVPDLVAAFGIGADIAAEMLIVAGDNPERGPLRARLRQTLRRRPDPRLLRHDHPAPAEPRRPPPSQRCPLPSRDRPPPIPPTHPGLLPAQDGRGPHQSRNHPLSQALVSPRDMELSATAPPSQATTRSCCSTAIGASMRRFTHARIRCRYRCGEQAPRARFHLDHG